MTVRIWNAWKQSVQKTLRLKPQEANLTTENPLTEDTTNSNSSVSIGHDNSVAIDDTSAATIATPDDHPPADSAATETNKT